MFCVDRWDYQKGHFFLSEFDMQDTNDIQLLTTGRIAELLGQPTERVCYVLSTRQIRHAARAGQVRLFNRDAFEQVQRELSKLDAKREVANA